MEAWSPLAAAKRDLFRDPVLTRIGQEYNKSAAQTALRYLVQRGITVIPKSSHEERMRANLELFDFVLSPEDIAQIERLDEGRTLFGWY